MGYVFPREPAVRWGIALGVVSLLFLRERTGFGGLVAVQSAPMRSLCEHGMEKPVPFEPPAGLRLQLALPGSAEPAWRIASDGVAELTVVLDEFELGAGSWVPLFKQAPFRATAVIGAPQDIWDGKWGVLELDAGDSAPFGRRFTIEGRASAVGLCSRAQLREFVLGRMHATIAHTVSGIVSRGGVPDAAALGVPQ